MSITHTIGRLLFNFVLESRGPDSQTWKLLPFCLCLYYFYFSIIIFAADKMTVKKRRNTHPSLFFFNDGANACRPTWEPCFFKSVLLFFPFFENLLFQILYSLYSPYGIIYLQKKILPQNFFFFNAQAI